MSPKERRAYRFGFLRAMRLARRDLHVMAQRFDDGIAELEDEMQGMRDEFLRWKAVEEAIAVERDFDTKAGWWGRFVGPGGNAETHTPHAVRKSSGWGAIAEILKTVSLGARQVRTVKSVNRWPCPSTISGLAP